MVLDEAVVNGAVDFPYLKLFNRDEAMGSSGVSSPSTHNKAKHIAWSILVIFLGYTLLG